MKTQRLIPNTLMLAVIGLVASLSQGAHAAAVNLQAVTGATANGTPGTPIDTSVGVPPTYVRSESSISVDLNSGAGFSFANSTGAYAVSSSALGIGSGSASTSMVFRFTNTGAAGLFNGSFHLYGGSLGNQVFSTLDIGESLLSTYTARISVNGSERYRSSATLTTTSTGSTLATDGTVLSPSDDGSDGFYSWNALDLVIDLGFVASGATVDILAELSSNSVANVGTYSYDCGGGGYGGYGNYGGYVQVIDVANRSEAQTAASGETCTDAKGRSGAFYGDPITINGGGNGLDAIAPANQGTVTAQAVPEPGALPLVALALAGLAAMRRRT